MKLLKLNIQLFASGSNSVEIASPSGTTYKWTLSTTFKETTTSTENNTSTISCSATLDASKIAFYVNNAGTLAVYWHDNKTNADTLVASISVSQCGKDSYYNFGSKTASGTITVEHKDDGTLSGYSKAVWTRNSTYTTVPYDGNVSTPNTTLTNIPRATNVPIVDGYVGIPYTITLNPASTTFRHTLRYTFGSLTNQTIATNVTNSYSWTMPTTFYAQIGASAKSKTGTLYVDTYSGNTLIDTKSASFTARTSEALAKPNVSITNIVDRNDTTTALTGNSSKIVLNASNVRITFNTLSSSNATISRTNIKVNGVTADSYNTSTGVGYCDINKPTTGTFTVTVTDSRGYSNSAAQTPTYINYTPLSISSATVKRTTAVTENKATLTVKGNYTTVNFGSTSNTLTLQYKIGSGSWTSLTPTISNNTYTKTQTLTNLLYTSSYTIYVKVTDKINTTGITSTLTLKRGTPIFWCDGESFNVEVTFNDRSIESRKKNFEDFDLDAIEVVKNGNIYKFNYDVETDDMKKHYGFVIPDKGGKFIVPEEVMSRDKTSVELYSMASILWEAMKQVIDKNEELEKEIKSLKESEK